jgi:putative transposase
MNRGNERQTIFHNDNEYASFVQLIRRACKRQPIKVLAFCLMPNHFHLCVQTTSDGELGKCFQWLMTAHVSQFRKSYPGHGHVWQGRFKAFPAQDGRHLLTVLRYIERNPVRANLVAAADMWPWSSAYPACTLELAEWPVRKPPDWLLRLREDDVDLAEVRTCANVETPYGQADWTRRIARD